MRHNMLFFHLIIILVNESLDVRIMWSLLANEKLQLSLPIRFCPGSPEKKNGFSYMKKMPL